MSQIDYQPEGGEQGSTTAYTGEEKQLLLHVSKELLSNSLRYVYGMSQILQGLTGLLLTAYITVGLTALREGYGIEEVPIAVTALPVLFLVASLVVGFALSYRSQKFALPLGDLETAFEIFEEVLATRRRQLLWPTILTALGLTTMIVIFFWVVYY